MFKPLLIYQVIYTQPEHHVQQLDIAMVVFISEEISLRALGARCNREGDG